MKRMIGILLALSLPWAAQAAQVTGLEVSRSENGEHVVLLLDGPASPTVFTVRDLPPRVVVDVPDGHIARRLALPPGYHGALLKGVRTGFYNSQTLRLVLDLTGRVDIAHAELEQSDKADHYTYAFDLVAKTAQMSPKAAQKAAPPEMTPVHARKSPRTASSHGEAEKPVIVIDAGHGGNDPGTSGHAGTLEKDQTLRYALALKAALLKTGRYRVFLTREDDRYLFLRDRVKRAREAGGNLFISLHADSAPTRDARGLSVYTISETASDKESAALAAKENKADVIGGMDLSDTSEDVADILIDLTQRETRARSAKFADLAVKSLGREVSLLTNTHRFAGFAVLKAPDIPSVLIEIGFLTSPKEETLIKSDAHRQKVARAIVAAVDRYYGVRAGR